MTIPRTGTHMWILIGWKVLQNHGCRKVVRDQDPEGRGSPGSCTWHWMSGICLLQNGDQEAKSLSRKGRWRAEGNTRRQSHAGGDSSGSGPTGRGRSDKHARASAGFPKANLLSPWCSCFHHTNWWWTSIHLVQWKEMLGFCLALIA